MTDRKTKDAQIAYLLIRLSMGLNFFMHGAVRIFGDLASFREGLVNGFQETLLPTFFVQAFATVLPFVEAGVGLLLLLGLFTRQAAVTGAVVMLTLIFGMSLRQEWGTVGSHMVYALFYYFLIRNASDNKWGLDDRRN